MKKLTKLSAINELYTPKQIEIYKRTLASDWFMLINHGAKRSGKTQLNNDLFLNELLRVRKQADLEGIKDPMYILSGATMGTIYQNILKELTNKYGIQFKFDKFNNFYMFGVYVVQVGHSTIGGLEKIRGMTSYGAYINEASLANEEVFDEIRSRCSGEGARIICDTNPDNPEHWLLKDYIQNPDKSIISYKFTLFDNTFLSKRYVENTINTTPSGVFTERNIHGLWVSGDGVIYSDFDAEVHFVNELPKFKTYIAGVDWGYSHYGVFVVFGITENDEYYLIEEHAEQFKEIDYWVEIAGQIKKRYGNIVFYCDSARNEHIARLRREGFRAKNGNKKVLSGIEAVAKRFKNNTLFISKSVKRFRTEIYNYIWDINGNPKKENDDVMDAIRYAIYSNENKGVYSFD